MTCPDIALFAEQGASASLDLATRAHLAECATCRATHRLLTLTQEAYASEIAVGEEELVGVTEMVLSQLVPEVRPPIARTWDAVSLGLLGTTTMGAVLFLTGAVSGLEAPELWLVLVLAGLGPIVREVGGAWPFSSPSAELNGS